MREEKHFEEKVRRFLKSQGAYTVKQFGCAFSKAGVPDLLCCVHGQFIGIELKSTTGRPSQLQLINLEQIKAAGGYAFLLYPKDFNKFKEFVVSLGDI